MFMIKMEDIAKMAGVSKSAVSIAFNDKPGISTETRQKILNIAREHGYVPKLRSSSNDPAMNKSLAFLVLTNSGIILEQYYQQPFFRELIYFVEERCRQKGYSLVFSSVDVSSFEKEIRKLAEEDKIHGIVFLGTNLEPSQISYAADLIDHLVVLDTCFDTLPVHFVEINNYMGAYQAGAHISSQGHERIGYIASDVRIHNFDERRRGFNAALLEYGYSPNECSEFSVAPTILSSQESLKKQLEGFLKKGKPMPSAIFCECDYIGISAMKTLTELGYRIPEDVSIVGFDNISESRIVSPELTTIHVDKKQMAYLAVDLLIQTEESESSMKTKTKVDTLFIKRQSSRPS
jgi:DNA-binding LacI/PurR family transcriptional regulator